MDIYSMSFDEGRPKTGDLSSASPKPHRAGRFLKPRKTEFAEDSAYLSQKNRGQVLEHKNQLLQHKLGELKADNKHLKLELMQAHTRMVQQSKRYSTDLAGANAILKEYKIQMQARELDFQKDLLTQRNVALKYQRALQEVTQVLVNALSQVPERPELTKSVMSELLGVKKRLDGKELDGALEQLKGACLFTVEEPLTYFSPSNSGKDLISTARFKDPDVSVDCFN